MTFLYPQHIISGTSLVGVALAATVGATSYMSQGVANLPVACCLASTSVLTAGSGNGQESGVKGFMTHRVSGLSGLLGWVNRALGLALGPEPGDEDLELPQLPL